MSNTEYKQVAERLLRQIQVTLSDTLTPDQSRALSTLKGLDDASLCRRAMLDPVAYKTWVSGAAPILPPRQFDMLQLILGFEKGDLVSDRIHFFDLNETRTPKEKLAQSLDSILPMLNDCTRSLVSDETGREIWSGGAKIHVLGLANGGYAVISHIQKMGIGSQPVSQRLESLRWASHGAAGDGARSDLIIPLKLSARLRTEPIVENDSMSRELVGHFHAAQEIKAHGSFRTLHDRIRPRPRSV